MTLPGADLIERGLADLARGVESIESLLIAIGAPRLRRLDVPIPPIERLTPQPEHRLYDFLCAQNPAGAHSRYNALIRRLVSYEHALEFERRRQQE